MRLVGCPFWLMGLVAACFPANLLATAAVPRPYVARTARGGSRLFQLILFVCCRPPSVLTQTAACSRLELRHDTDGSSQHRLDEYRMFCTLWRLPLVAMLRRRRGAQICVAKRVAFFEAVLWLFYL
jgi:hypothetical protein